MLSDEKVGALEARITCGTATQADARLLAESNELLANEKAEVEAALRAARVAVAEKEAALQQTHDEIERAWSEHWKMADDADDDGSHVGIATYHRSVARGLGEARQILIRRAALSGAPAGVTLSEEQPLRKWPATDTPIINTEPLDDAAFAGLKAQPVLAEGGVYLSEEQRAQVEAMLRFGRDFYTGMSDAPLYTVVSDFVAALSLVAAPATSTEEAE